MAFTPVELIGPTGNKYTAMDAIDLNDRITEGYCRVEIQDAQVEESVTPTPFRRFTTVGDYVEALVDENEESATA